MTNTALDFVTRKERIRSSSPVYRRGHQRAAKAAAALSRVGWAKAAAELANEALTEFIRLCYAYDKAAGTWPHIDIETGVIWPPTPMSSRNYSRWGLRRKESRILRAHVIALEEEARKGKGEPPALVYDSLIRRWLLNLGDYPARRDALAWWERHELSARRFLELSKRLAKG